MVLFRGMTQFFSSFRNFYVAAPGAYPVPLLCLVAPCKRHGPAAAQ